MAHDAELGSALSNDAERGSARSSYGATLLRSVFVEGFEAADPS
jgi:hypothetical protein